MRQCYFGGGGGVGGARLELNEQSAGVGGVGAAQQKMNRATDQQADGTEGKMPT